MHFNCDENTHQHLFPRVAEKFNKLKKYNYTPTQTRNIAIVGFEPTPLSMQMHCHRSAIELYGFFLGCGNYTIFK